jgi:hypothetical protein
MNSSERMVLSTLDQLNTQAKLAQMFAFEVLSSFELRSDLSARVASLPSIIGFDAITSIQMWSSRVI